MEIFLKQIIFLKLTLSVLLLVLWWPEVLLTAIISSLSNPMEALKVERKIYGLDTAQKFLSGVKTEVRVDNYKGPFQSLLKSNREASSAKYSLSCLRYVFSAISLKKICLWGCVLFHSSSWPAEFCPSVSEFTAAILKDWPDMIIMVGLQLPSCKIQPVILWGSCGIWGIRVCFFLILFFLLLKVSFKKFPLIIVEDTLLPREFIQIVR